ncbi:hypothetical protein Misp01_28200 [Microtetraspora sp. NBRC 13810]|uniref:ankyrin repeat domain-containing protein n=1 Tax=Microtetraspora sp. NBRC 13810 TaxID=3030990 RepID=UPI0024A12F9F|nr:ankyrin repeat domain-containing protein [Microtetraspora sp. NBRC 13810]GLW07690.1 hypothetical protein Misp01_28200 [Microtetraspora sp. NBRC 13810]
MDRGLLDAVTRNDVDQVRELLEGGTADPAGEGEPTALYRAAVDGRAEIVDLLLARGADANRFSGDADDDEGLPLCGAAARGLTSIVEALLAAGADPLGKEAGGWSALLWAAAKGHREAAETLLAAGADADDSNDDGDTALTLAARRGAPGVVQALLAHGVDPERPDGDGDTALAIAEEWLGVHLESALLEQFEGDDESPEDHRIAVTRTMTRDGTELVTLTEYDGDGEPVREVESQRGHTAVVTLLERAADVYVAVPDLVRRAVTHRDADDDHETWWIVVEALAAREDDEVFETATALCLSDEPREREFAADLLGRLAKGGDEPAADDERTGRSLAALRRLARIEGDEPVLDSVLNALGKHGDQRALPEVLGILGRPGRTPTPADPGALAAVLPPGHEEGLALLIAMTADPDADVRDWATLGLAGLEADDARIRDALAARLDDTSLTAVAEAVRGLAARGDERAAAGVRRVLAESDDDYARDLVREAAQKIGIPEIG